MLEKLPAQRHPDLLVGYNQADDSGVMRLNDDTALIQTLDFFPAIVDDPYIFGQVAAANALSDIFAMGGRVLTAMNIVGFPDGDLPLDVLGDMLRGGAEKVNEAGGVVVGGHTIKDSELKYGLAVSGIVHPERIVEIRGARPGDALVLTKPLGTGIYSTALKKDALPAGREALFYRTMSELNMTASVEMINFGAHACTDVTGFGLLGHAFEMAETSDVTIRIDTGSLPVLPGVLDYAAAGFLTGGGMSNLEYVESHVSYCDDITREWEMLLCDAQTSGGLLISLPAGEAERLVRVLHERGVDSAAIIGEVTERASHRIEVRC